MEAVNKYKKGLWTEEEDRILLEYIREHGRGQWNRIPKVTGLKRCGKSCRLRWLNYLSPTVKRGDFSEEEEDLIIRLHNLLGNRWSLIAGRVPGRTDNQVKNHWNTHLCKKLGIKKKNSRKVKGTPKVHKSDMEETHGLSKLSPNGETKTAEEKRMMRSQNPLTAASNQASNEEEEAPMMSNHLADQSSPLFPDDHDHLILDSPGLLDFLDGYPFDLMWQNF